MPTVTVLGQADKNHKIQIKGVFTQKKKLLEAMESISPVALDALKIYDPVKDSEDNFTYPKLCSFLRNAGWCILVDDSKSRVFVMTDAATNEVRDWDLDEHGEAKYNPLKKD